MRYLKVLDVPRNVCCQHRHFLVRERHHCKLLEFTNCIACKVNALAIFRVTGPAIGDVFFKIG